jgi:uncharacterized protein YkwD
MTDRDTAQRCHTVARAWTRSRRHVVASATVLGISLAAFAPAAAAHGTSHCRGALKPISATSRHEMQRAVVCLINHERTRRHLPRLHSSRRLSRSAQGWTNAMVSHAGFGHGSDFAARITAVGFNWSSVGENIAAGFATPASVVQAWMASTGHCQNILNPNFADVGTGVSGRAVPGFGRAGTWTQDFGLPMGGHAPSGNWAPANGCPYSN